MIVHPPLTDLAVGPLILLAVEELFLSPNPFDLPSYQKRKTLKLFLGFSALCGCWIAYLSGIYHLPYKEFLQTNETYLNHQLLGKILLIQITFASLVNFLLCTLNNLKKNAIIISIIYKLLILTSLTTVSYTSYLGGQLVFG